MNETKIRNFRYEQPEKGRAIWLYFMRPKDACPGPMETLEYSGLYDPTEYRENELRKIGQLCIYHSDLRLRMMQY